MVQLWAQWATRTRTILRRLPKNLRSNRWWIVWNGNLYISRAAAATIPGHPKDSPLLSENVAYVHWSQFLQNPALIGAERRAVFVPELGMFGNMTRRLAAALAIADALKTGHVVVPESARFQGGIFANGVHTVSSGAAFWLFSVRGATSFPVHVFHKKELIEAPGVTREFYAPHIDGAWRDLHAIAIPKANAPAFPLDHLVIHLRGGDVFGPRKPASYGQPPLAFYEQILDHESWSAVTVVHQDSNNPVLKPLLESCTTRKIPVTTQSGNVVDDIAVLLGASTLVAGRGTFMPAVVGLSRSVKRVFYFHDKFSIHPPVSGVEIVRIIDAEGTYVRDVLSNNWENSEYQRDLMLTYPQSNLGFSTVN